MVGPTASFAPGSPPLHHPIGTPCASATVPAAKPDWLARRGGNAGREKDLGRTERRGGKEERERERTDEGEREESDMRYVREGKRERGEHIGESRR